MRIRKETKIIIRLWGGVGNQLFQYAFGQYLREALRAEVVYDIASFKHSDKQRVLELPTIIKSLQTIYISLSKHTGIIHRIARIIYSIRNTFIDEKNFSMNKVSAGLTKGDVYLQGYWQREEYARGIRKQLIKLQIELPPQLSELLKLIGQDNMAVALHVRRGDYFTPKNIKIFGICDSAYYERAIHLLKERLMQMPTFYVFSDDLEWVKKNIQLPQNTVFVPNYEVPQYYYIYLMSVCRHIIISNSTFSWWGAYLNKNRDGMVISPRQWVRSNSFNLALMSWLKI
jgi:hypothetical protein